MTEFMCGRCEDGSYEAIVPLETLDVVKAALGTGDTSVEWYISIDLTKFNALHLLPGEEYQVPATLILTGTLPTRADNGE